MPLKLPLIMFLLLSPVFAAELNPHEQLKQIFQSYKRLWDDGAAKIDAIENGKLPKTAMAEFYKDEFPKRLTQMQKDLKALEGKMPPQGKADLEDMKLLVTLSLDFDNTFNRMAAKPGDKGLSTNLNEINRQLQVTTDRMVARGLPPPTGKESYLLSFYKKCETIASGKGIISSMPPKEAEILCWELAGQKVHCKDRTIHPSKDSPEQILAELKARKVVEFNLTQKAPDQIQFESLDKRTSYMVFLKTKHATIISSELDPATGKVIEIKTCHGDVMNQAEQEQLIDQMKKDAAVVNRHKSGP